MKPVQRGPVSESNAQESDRKLDEAEFHDRRERDKYQLAADEFERRYSNLKFYSVVEESRAAVAKRLGTIGHNGVCLDYCCGVGDQAEIMARKARLVVGIDISQQSLANAQHRLVQPNSRRPIFVAGDAERLPFPDSTFDLILCNGVLHHLDLESAYRELARVVKPTGTVVCLEALAHNPLFALYRRMTPHLRTAWEVDHIIRMRDIRRSSQHFGTVRTQFFHLVVVAAAPLRRSRWFRPLLSVLTKIDRQLMRVPLLQLMGWQVLFELSQPKKRSN